MGGIRRFIALACIILLASIAPVSAITYQLNYDANGNLVDDGRFAYEYDDINQLIKVSNAQGVLEEYAYDESGDRIIKIIHNLDGTKTAVYTPFKEFSREIGTETKDTVFYYDDQALVARKDASGTYFYHPDHLGSTDIVTDEQGNVVEQYEYLPFGAQLSGADSRFTFTGQEKDNTGLMYYKSRYYEPVIGRFIQPDTMLPDIYDPQQLNRYAYARNNPIKYNDPSGHILGQIISGLWALANQAFAAAATFFTTGIYPVMAPIWMAQSAQEVETAVENPSTANVCWGVVAAADIITPGLPEGKIAKAGVGQLGRAGKKVGSIFAKGEDIVQIPTNKLYGHATDNPLNIFREGAKTHLTDPIEVIQVGDKFMINDGVGRSLRAFRSGETAVNAKVIRSYSSVDQLNTLAKEGYTTAKNDLVWLGRTTRIDDPARLMTLGIE